MNTKNINFKQTKYFNSLIIDFIEGNENAKEFYAFNNTFYDIKKVIEEKSKEIIDRKILVDTIKNQYQNIEISTAIQQNINSIENKNTFCVVTAHQLNIFGGPLYYIYKIAQTISTCNRLNKKYSNYNFIPIYWMGSEDHDFEEINHIYLYNKKIIWNENKKGASGNFSTENILPLIDEIQTILGNEKYAEELIKIFKHAYQHENLSEATRYLINELFGEYGLLVVDGNVAKFKSQFKTIIKDELLQQSAERLVNINIEKFKSKNYKSQATPRNINLFYLKDDTRERIELDKTNDTYKVINTNIIFTKDEILEELEKFPERFSPNVILRPLFQQKILPAVAFIGGAGEIAYWLQLKSTFEFYKINFPILLLRNSGLILPNNFDQKLDKLHLNLLDFFDDIEQLKRKHIEQFSDYNIVIEKQEIFENFEKIKEKSTSIDASLQGFVGAEINKLHKSFETIETKVNKALKLKNETALNQIEKMHVQLFPNKNLQERVENFSVYYSKLGKLWIKNLIEEFDVFEKQFLMME